MAADLEAQKEFEHLFAKNHVNKKLRDQFNDPLIMKLSEENQLPYEFVVSLCVQMAIHKRANLETLVGLLWKHFHAEGQNPFQQCANALVKAAQFDIVDFDPMVEEFIVRFDCSQDVWDELDRYQYPLPLLVPPKNVNNNNSSGYYTFNTSVILKKENHHEDDVCLEHLNRLNSIKLRVDTNVVSFVKHQMKTPERKAEETYKDYKMRMIQFNKFKATVEDVVKHILVFGGEFWLTWRYDKRGRCYSQGYHLNPQGAQYQKASIEFAEGEKLNDC